MTTYRTVCSMTAGELDSQVNTALSEDWELFGNPYSVGDAFCQALVKDSGSEPHSGSVGFSSSLPG